MHEEMTNMTNEEMFTAIVAHMDSMESVLNGLNGRMDKVESVLNGLSGRMDKVESGLNGLNKRIDKMESDNDMEFQAIRMEMDVANKLLRQDIFVLNDKVDRIMFIKDVDGYEEMKTQVTVLTQGYQELKEKIG